MKLKKENKLLKEILYSLDIKNCIECQHYNKMLECFRNRLKNLKNNSIDKDVLNCFVKKEDDI